MKKQHGLIAVAVLMFAGLAWRQAPRRLCSGFLPPNDLKIPVGSKEAAGLTHEQFDAVLDRIQAVYGPIVASRGGTLEVDRRWDDATVNASATRAGNTWSIHMYGGLARHEAVTQDGFTLVACHELGHHLGGVPKAGIIFNRWASNEGQSDYFGDLKCARRMFVDAGSRSFTRASLTDPVAEAACNHSFPNEGDRKICNRSAIAGLSLANLLQQIGREPQTPKFDTPDPTVVSRTNNAHPKAQCRLDTYLQGSICMKPLSEDVDDRDPAHGTCTLSGGYTAGMRPLCWYKPPEGQLIARSLSLSALAQPGSAFSSLGRADLWQGR